METAIKAKALDEGNRPYQLLARQALPLLVRLANSRSDIRYGDLAKQLGMPNPRNLNYVLGSVGTTLEQLSDKWGEQIPAIQCLVVNKTRLPGRGVGWFVRDKGEFDRLSRREKQAIVDRVHADSFAYPKWNHVLATLDIEPVTTSLEKENSEAAAYRGGVESDEHRALKDFVARSPTIIGLPAKSRGQEEVRLPSGDSIDVFFNQHGKRTAVEVKSRISPEPDVIRGIYQCVKYRAVLNAMISAENSGDVADAVLVMESELPDRLRLLRQVLRVRVLENVKPK